jgi:VCBS repeat-containing protein
VGFWQTTATTRRFSPPSAAILLQGPANGALTLNSDGSFTYVPKANFSGTDSFVYKSSDEEKHSSNQTVTITVNPVSDAPVAAADGVFTTAHNHPARKERGRTLRQRHRLSTATR